MTILELWDAFALERSVTITGSTPHTTYPFVRRWVAKCPFQDPAQLRLALVWVLKEAPAKSAKVVAQYVKAMAEWGANEDVRLLERNPVATFRLPKTISTGAEPVVLSSDAVITIVAGLRSANRRGDARWDLVAEFMLQTGLRTCEAFGLEWPLVDTARCRAHIRQSMLVKTGLRQATKTGKERYVPLNERALWVLRQLEPITGEGDFLFPWNANVYMHSFRKITKRLEAAGELPRAYRPYDLRHTHISRLLEAGIPVAQVARWAGNSPQTIWRHYAATVSNYEMPVL